MKYNIRKERYVAVVSDDTSILISSKGGNGLEQDMSDCLVQNVATTIYQSILEGTVPNGQLVLLLWHNCIYNQ